MRQEETAHLTESQFRKDKEKAKSSVKVTGALGAFWLYCRLAWVDYSRKACLSCIAIFAIAICVLISMVAQGLITKIPIVFYNTSAATEGEIDIIVEPSNSRQLNGTQIRSILAGVTQNKPVFRIYSIGYMSKSAAKLEPQDNFFAGDDIEVVALKTFFLDIGTENQIGLGTKDALEETSHDEAWLSSRAANQLSLAEGATVNLRVQLPGGILRWLRGRYFNLTGERYQQTKDYVISPFKIRIFSDDLVGRFPDSEDINYAAILNIKSVMGHLGPGFSQEPVMQQVVREVALEDWGDQMIVQFNNRLELYLNGDYNVILRTAVPLGSQIMNTLKAFDLTISMPLVSALEFTKFANAVISLTFNMILAGVILLASYVINNIISMNIHSKVYHTAIQRTVGLSRGQLFNQILVYSIGFSLFGVLLAAPGVYGVFGWLNGSVLPGVNAGFTIQAEFRNTFVSLLLALLIPFFSAVAPMLSLMYENIAWSLDKDHSKTLSVKVSIESQHDKFPWTIFMVSVFSAALGIFIQVLLPLSMASLNVTIFIIVFFALMGCILFGLLLIFLNFSYLYESLILKFFIFFDRDFVKRLVRMNLITHRIRNRKTVLIYSLSLAFVNFLYVSLVMQQENSQTRALRSNGSRFNLEATAMSRAKFDSLLDVANLRGKVAWSAVGQNWRGLQEELNLTAITVMNRGGLVSANQRFYTASPNIFRFLEKDFEKVSSPDPLPTTLDPVQLMYTRFGSNGAIVSEALRKYLNIDCSNPRDTFAIKMTYSRSNFEVKEANCVASMARFPGFRQSSRSGMVSGDSVFAQDAYLSLMDGISMPFERTLNYSRIHVQVTAASEERGVKERIKTYQGSYGYGVFSFEDYVKRFKSTSDIMLLLFNVLTVLALILSLFSLISTMAANIVEQAKELAVLRCVGLGKLAITRIFLYESVVVILTGGFIGIAIGLLLGSTIAAQNAMFTNSETTLAFPWSILITIVIFSFVSSLFAAAIPVWVFLKKKIVELIKSIS